MLARQPWLLPTAALVAWLAVLAFLLPYDPDEAVYSIIARGMIDGQWPYRDLFDHKPPLLYVAYLPAGFGASIEVQRLLAAVCVAASFAPLWALARRWLAEPARTPAVVAYAFALANPFLIIGANAEAFMLLPLVGAIAALSPWIAGALFGVTLAIKPAAIVFAPVLMYQWRAQTWKPAAGAMLVIAVVSAPFIPIWSEYWDANVTFNLEYAQHASRSWADVLSINVWVLLGSLALWFAAAWGIASRPPLVLVIWALCAVLSVKIPGYDWAHYYVLLAPPAALLAAAGWVHLRTRSAMLRAILAGTAGVSIALMIGVLIFARGANDRDEALADAISRVEGEFYLAGSDSQLYAYADEQPRRRYFFSVPLAVRSAIRTEMEQDLAACPPASVALVESGFSGDDLDWHAFLGGVYAEQQAFDDAVLYTRPTIQCER